MKKVAILGGGYGGIAAAYDLKKSGHEVVLFEKEVSLGGLASGFDGGGWDWKLDRAYHHIFSSDRDILDFADELGVNIFEFSTPTTANLYETPLGWKQFALDSPVALLRFSLLTPLQRLRAGFGMALLKLSPFFALYEKTTAKDFLVRLIGIRAWEVLFEPLFRKKFGKYAENILATFIWARIKKRTPSLGYPRGGFQTLTDLFETKLVNSGVNIKKAKEILNITKEGEGFLLDGEKFDCVISTLPTRVMARVLAPLLSENEKVKFSKLKYLHAINCILAGPQKLLPKNYWLSLCIPSWGAMVAVQHTNFVDKSHYHNEELLYLAKYVDDEDPLLKASDEEVFHFFTDPLKNINPAFEAASHRRWIFKAGLAQPIFDKEFLDNLPKYHSDTQGLYFANLDMTYPYDRGTNFAIKLGREVAKIVQNEFK